MLIEEDISQPNQLTLMNMMVLVLSVYVLFALAMDAFFVLPPEVSRLLDFIDNCICIFFLFEFCFRFYHAEAKWRFMRWGWIDLVSSIPVFGFLRVGRVLRLIRLLRILRAFRSVRHLVSHVFKNKAKGVFTTVALLALLILIFSSIAILQVEKDPASNIKTAEDAVWWSYVTITTVGYGDRYPVTTEGRIIACLLMTTGVGLFGTFAGFVSSWLLDGKKYYGDS